MSDMEEYIQKLLYYLPIDFGDTENNEYKTYLVCACCENYTNEKFQFSLMAFHMLFMAFLYKEFWTLKTYSHERVKDCAGLMDNLNQWKMFLILPLFLSKPSLTVI